MNSHFQFQYPWVLALLALLPVYAFLRGQAGRFSALRFPSADLVTVASGRPVVVFNIAHNRYRLIAAVHHNTRIVYTLMILTHKEYDRNAWKEQL